MKRFKLIFAFVLCFCLLPLMLGGCKKKENTPIDAGITVFTTFYPFYAATQMIVKDVPDVNLNLLVQPQDGCLRDYQLSDWDLALLSSADLVIAGGCGLESFENLLYALGENGPAVVPVLYNMDLQEHEAVNSQSDTQSHWQDPNPHIYMRSESMPEILQRITDSLILLDSENETLYQKNHEKALEQIEALSAEIKATSDSLSGNKAIVMNEALIYPALEYGLTIELCYERESGEDLYDADLADCLQTLAKADAEIVLIEKQAPSKLSIALTEAGYKLAYMDVLSTRRADEGAEAYFDALRSNVHTVKDAFAASNTASESTDIGRNE